MSARVLHVVAGGEIGGAERVALDLATYPWPAGTSHAVALFAATAGLRRFVNASGARVHDRGLVREHAGAQLWRALGPADVAWLAEVVRAEAATVVHVHTFASQVVGTRAGLRCGVPVLRTEHSARVYRDVFCWPFARWSLRWARAVVAVSGFVAGLARARAPWAAAKIAVIPNGVRVFPAAPAGAGLAPPDASPFELVSVGRLEPRKDLALGLDALALVSGVRLAIVGDGPSRRSLEAHARRVGVADRVTFHGYQADPSGFVARADAAFTSARDEGLGLALLEAMAAGKPVVGVAVGGIPEIVRPDETGWLARRRDAPALAEVIARAAASRARARQLGARARAFVNAHHSLAAAAAAYGAIYERLSAAPDAGRAATG